ncbi:MAG: hypothetical protein H0U75_08710 [Legionella sp.]|nr:hypothetical protein [Legionella sp.]
MREKIRSELFKYYLFPSKNRIWAYQDRVDFVKQFLNRVMFSSGFLGLLFISLNILECKFASKIVFPFFLVSLMSYYLYGVMISLLRNEKLGKIKRARE